MTNNVNRQFKYEDLNVARIIKKNLVYIIGIPEEIAKTEVNIFKKDIKQA